MNTEYRNKLFNRIKDVFEKEETQERQGFLEARENFENKQTTAFELARQVVERSYPMEDVNTLRQFKKKYGDPCDVVAKDKCFYFSHSEDVDEDSDEKETKSHFDFGLYGNLNGSEYGDGENCEHFAHAYYREELKENGLNPDIYAQQSGKDSNPHKTKHVDANNKFLGKSGRYDDNIGMTSKFDKQFELDVIGTSHCRSRAIACTKNEYEQLRNLLKVKHDERRCIVSINGRISLLRTHDFSVNHQSSFDPNALQDIPLQKQLRESYQNLMYDPIKEFQSSK